MSTRASSSAGAAAGGPHGNTGDVDLAPAPSVANASAIGDPGAEDRYARIRRLIGTDRCVLLDGATGTELIDVGGERPEAEEHLWGVTAILDSPDQVKAVHRRYVDAGCDVISTNTWGLPTALREGGPKLWESLGPIHWMDVARGGVRLARAAAEEAQRGAEVAVAFSINGDVDTPDGRETIRLLDRAFEQEPPDLILLETLSLVRASTFATVETLLATGLPVWLSFRRCRHGVCGVYGEHWGAPPRETRSGARRDGSRRWASGRCRSIACHPTTSPGCCPGCETSPIYRWVCIRTSAISPPRVGDTS
jgi:Homocysteine S-methyltransferase